MSTRRPFQWLFLASALVAGLVYWWQADWWIVWRAPTHPPGRHYLPGFLAPWWWQLAVSVVVGLLAGAALAAAARLLWYAWPRLTGRGRAHPTP
jgi:hypothetical protein